MTLFYRLALLDQLDLSIVCAEAFELVVTRDSARSSTLSKLCHK